MGHQMNTILLLLIFTGLVGLLLVVFFMLDRLNELHKHADLQKTPHKPDDTFGGLSGKELWDAMIGIPLPGWDAKKLEPLKPRYEALLQKHLELLFEDGKLDAREGFAMPVRCDRVVPTLRGEIESWLPHEYASGIYRAGQDLINLPPEEHEAVLSRIDDIGEALYSATNLPPRHLLSKVLVPASRPTEEEPPVDGEASSEEEMLPAEDAAWDGEEPVLEGDAVAALPAPEEADYLPVDLTEDSGEMLPLSEDVETAENAAEANPESAGEIEVSTETEAVAETPAEPEKATVS
ncbi:MAG: hypothetical protein RI928_2154 [Pseudomonadota bacterium]|jgi:hypothetical protein